MAAKGNRSMNLGKVHDDKLFKLKELTGLSFTAIIRRGIDAVELEEARRDKELNR